jgi:ATP-dependent Zn protease
MPVQNGLWFMVLTIVVLILIFGVFVLWTNRSSVKEALRGTTRLWRQFKAEDYTEQELRRNIMFNRSRGNVKSEAYWQEILDRKFPKDN